MDRLNEEMLRALLRVARRSAGGHAGIALRLAVDQARREPALSGALAACLVTAVWGRLVREELAGRSERAGR